MVRNTAREIAIHLSYELSFTDKDVDALLDDRLTAETFATLAAEDEIYQESPNAKQAEYIRRLVKGVDEHGAELDGYIAKYAKGWNFARIPGDGEVHQRHPGQLRAAGDRRISKRQSGAGGKFPVRLCFSLFSRQGTTC